MKIKLLVGICLIACAVTLARSEDFKTIDGKEFKNARISRVEPNGIVVITKAGVSKIYFAELPQEIQRRFHDDAQKADARIALCDPQSKTLSFKTCRKAKLSLAARPAECVAFVT